MSLKEFEMNAKLLKQLARIAELDPSETWQEAALEVGLDEGRALRLMVALQDAKRALLSQTGQDDEVFQAWTLGEWCQLVHVLEHAAEHDAELKKLAIPLLKQFRLHPAYAVYTQLRQACAPEEETSCAVLFERAPETERKMQQLEGHILRHEVVELRSRTQHVTTVVPTKLIHVEGEMSLICEESQHLLAIPLSDVAQIKATGEVRTAHAVSVEVAEFIQALRSMSDAETRLILKIKDPAHFTLIPDYEFLGRPCLVTNPDGDVIWAAYVEPSEELFQWLDGLQEQVEILDPPSFAADFETYREAKSRKLA